MPGKEGDGVSVLQQAEGLAEHAAEIGAVDLVEDEHDWQWRLLVAGLHVARSADQEPWRVDGLVAIEPKPADELLVAEAGVELNPLDVLARQPCRVRPAPRRSAWRPSAAERSRRISVSARARVRWVLLVPGGP